MAEETVPGTAPETVPEVTPPAEPTAPVVKPEVNAGGDGELGEDGVPLRNRVAEARRKQEEAEQKAAESERRRQELELELQRRDQLPPVMPPAASEGEIDPYERQQEEKTRRIAAETLRLHNEANAYAYNLLDFLATKNPLITRFRTQIETQVLKLSPEHKLLRNGASIIAVANMVIGENAHTLLNQTPVKTPVKPKEDEAPPENVAPTLPPKPSPSPERVVLTAEEEEFAESRGYWEHFTPEEIRERFKKRQEQLAKIEKDKKKR